MTPHPIPPIEVLQSLSLADIAERYGVHRDTVCRWRRKLGIVTRRGKYGGRVAKYDHEQIRAEIRAGKSPTEIAKSFGCTLSLVSQQRKVMGLPAQKRGKGGNFAGYTNAVIKFDPERLERRAGEVRRRALGMNKEQFTGWLVGKVWTLEGGFVEAR